MSSATGAWHDRPIAFLDTLPILQSFQMRKVAIPSSRPVEALRAGRAESVPGRCGVWAHWAMLRDSQMTFQALRAAELSAVLQKPLRNTVMTSQCSAVTGRPEMSQILRPLKRRHRWLVWKAPFLLRPVLFKDLKTNSRNKAFVDDNR